MMANLQHPLVVDYLTRLRSEALRLPDAEARDLVADIEEHFQAAEREGRTSEAELRTLIDRLGRPEDVVAAAAPDRSAPSAPPVPRREATTVGLLLTAEVPALTVLLLPIGIIVWIIGMVMLALCRRWNTSQRGTAWVVLASGLPIAMLALAVGSLAMSVSTQTCETGADGVEVCRQVASSGPPMWLPWLLAFAGIGYAVLQVVVARRLLSAVGEFGPRPRGLRLR